MTRVAVLISWYDESPAWLSQCVASVSKLRDVIGDVCVVAVDGAYETFPQSENTSPLEQREAVVQAADSVGLPLILHVPHRKWRSEMEKRTGTVLAAQPYKPDWLVVLDADEVIHHVSPVLQHDLSETDRHVCTYGLIDGFDEQGESDAMAQLAQNTSLANRWATPVRSVYRNLPNLRFEQRHYWVLADVDGETKYLWGHQEFHDVLPARDLSNQLQVVHRNRFRSRRRMQQAQAYYQLRETLGLEPMLPVHVESVDGEPARVA